MNELTPDLQILIRNILGSDMGIYGYEELLRKTLKDGNYKDEDRTWLNVIRTKWIRYYKKEQQQFIDKINNRNK